MTMIVDPKSGVKHGKIPAEQYRAIVSAHNGDVTKAMPMLLQAFNTYYHSQDRKNLAALSKKVGQ